MQQAAQQATGPKVRMMTVEMVQVRLMSLRHRQSIDPKQFLETLISCQGVLMVVEAQSPGEIPEVMPLLDLVNSALFMASQNALDRLKSSGTIVVH